jgi:hypothetical protein
MDKVNCTVIGWPVPANSAFVHGIAPVIPEDALAGDAVSAENACNGCEDAAENE